MLYTFFFEKRVLPIGGAGEVLKGKDEPSSRPQLKPSVQTAAEREAEGTAEAGRKRRLCRRSSSFCLHLSLRLGCVSSLRFHPKAALPDLLSVCTSGLHKHTTSADFKPFGEEGPLTNSQDIEVEES